MEVKMEMDNVLQTYTWTSRAAAEPVFGTAWEYYAIMQKVSVRAILATITEFRQVSTFSISVDGGFFP